MNVDIQKLVLLPLGLAAVLYGQAPGKSVTVPVPKLVITPQTVSYHEILAKPGLQQPIESTVTTLAVRRDGSTSLRNTVKALDGTTVVDRTHELFFSNGDRAEINDVLQIITAVKTRLAFSPHFSMLKPETDCSVSVSGGLPEGGRSIGASSVLGYRTIGYRQDRSEMRITIWYAPDLGCTQLRRLAEFKDKSGVVTDTSDRIATSIVSGEPDPAHFEIPAGYEAVQFSEHAIRSAKRRGETLSPDALEPFRQLDEIYQRHRIDDLSSLGRTPRRYTE